jgi:hypothetical protein
MAGSSYLDKEQVKEERKLYRSTTSDSKSRAGDYAYDKCRERYGEDSYLDSVCRYGITFTRSVRESISSAIALCEHSYGDGTKYYNACAYGAHKFWDKMKKHHRRSH